MRSVWNIINGNREECIKFLEGQPNEKYVFAEYDKDEMEWMNPNVEDEDDKYCYADEVAPSVTYADDNGYVAEFIVTEIYLAEDTILSGKRPCVKAVNVQDYHDQIDVPVTWLYGASECYIYEMMMNLKLVREE